MLDAFLTQRQDIYQIQQIGDDQHGHDACVAEAELLGDENGGLVAGKAREAPCGQNGAVDFRDVVHAVVVGQNRGNDGEARAVAGVDDEQGEADDRRPEAAEHDAGGDAENEQQDVDAAGETVGPPCENEAAAAVHEAGEGDERRDGAFGVADDVVFHHLLGERNQAEAGGDVEEHEQP